MENAEYKILQKDRHNYGIDLLRIVAMLLIICYHITRYSDQLSSASVDSHEFSSIILGSWGILGVDLFVIVSAWFLAESNFKIQKVIGLIFETFCYMTIFVGVAFGVQCFQNGTAGAAKWLILFISDSLLEPIWSKNYWFISAYLILYLLFPCINSVIRNCSDKKLSKIVILLSFIPFYANYASEFSVVMNVTYFVYIYFLVALLKRKKKIFLKSMLPLER